jgi:tRNA threonylcarbamoyladenosine biosynthesis protein TsaE
VRRVKCRLTLATVEDTHRLAAALAPLLQPGDAVLLEGPLGAGKTEFARALLRAALGDPALTVPSPSFTLVQTYEDGGRVFHHFDLWRLTGPDSLAELGWHDARADVVIVEWPDRLGLLHPPDGISLQFTVHANNTREIEIAGLPEATFLGAGGDQGPCSN